MMGKRDPSLGPCWVNGGGGQFRYHSAIFTSYVDEGGYLTKSKRGFSCLPREGLSGVPLFQDRVAYRSAPPANRRPIAKLSQSIVAYSLGTSSFFKNKL